MRVIKNLITILIIIPMVVSGSYCCHALDSMPPSQNPPGGLPPRDVPQFVTFGWDDNFFSGYEGNGSTGGMKWLLELSKNLKNPYGCGDGRTYDGKQVLFAFYLIGKQLPAENGLVREAWHQAYKDGHELGNHSYSHRNGDHFTIAEWDEEIQKTVKALGKSFMPVPRFSLANSSIGIGINSKELHGFRAPYLKYNDPLFTALQRKRILYDCSIEEGWKADQDGTNYYWPYTLDYGSPGNKYLVDRHEAGLIQRHRGLWEMPVYVYIIPPDEICERYDIPPGLRTKIAQKHGSFRKSDGKIDGVDATLIATSKNGGYGSELTRDEYLATLKYNLDLRLNGNRAPLNVTGHSNNYSSKYTGSPNMDESERRQVIEEFIQYALSKPEVRIVRPIDVINWMRHPVPLAKRVSDAL